MVDSEEEKQNYLRENILDKGYEAEDFVTYLTSKKGDEGVDLGNWSLNELKLVVQEYILTHSKSDSQTGNNFQSTPQIQNNVGQNNIVQNQMSTTQDTNTITTATATTSQNMDFNMNNNISNLNNMNMGINNQNMNMIMNMNPNMNLGINQNMNMGMNTNMNLVMNPNMNMGMNTNMNLVMNPNMNMGMSPNMNMGLNNNIINNNINNLSTPELQNNMNQNFMSFSPAIEPEEKTDIYGITELDTILCSICEKSEMSKFGNIKIELSLGEKVAGNIFRKAYMTYIVSTSPLNLKVRRRYSDFEWLRQILLNFFSSSVIPPIPKKNKLIGGDRFDETFLLKRMRTLERFLNLLMEDPMIKVSQILYDFLSIEEEDKFNEKKKNYNNFKLPAFLRDYKSLNGKLDITINEERETFYQNIKDNTELNQDILTKLNKNMKLLNSEMQLVINRMDEISKNCEELYLNSVKYSDIKDIKISYYQLNDMFKDWSTALKKTSNVINVNIREYFKYTKNTFRSMKELINIVDNYKQNYYKAKRNLISKKEDLFKKGDISKWDLGPNKDMVIDLLKDKNIALPKMLCNETNAVINIKQLYGYYLNCAKNEFERIRKLNGFGHKKNISDNSKLQITILSELFKNISDIAICSPKYDMTNIEKETEQKYGEKEKENDKNKKV